MFSAPELFMPFVGAYVPESFPRFVGSAGENALLM